ncbi:MAG: GNAT family N-acetyltransferase [Erysipelothrix sp.]
MIRKLNKEDYVGKTYDVTYTTDSYYDVELLEDVFWGATLIKKPFEEIQHKEFSGEFFADHLENPKLFGLEVDGDLVGFIQIGEESWHQRMRISDIIIDDSYRNRGYGSQLIKYVIEFVEDKPIRELVLEVQSCNTKAIEMYQKNGFKIMGIDLTHYTNQDIENREVRLEMTLIIA